MHAQEFPDKNYWPELRDACSRAIGKIRSEFYTKMGLEVASDKKGVGPVARWRLFPGNQIISTKKLLFSSSQKIPVDTQRRTSLPKSPR